MPIPIPKRPSGYTVGDLAANVKIDAFVDIQCPHSLKAWPTLLALVDYFSEESISLTVHALTLSNHRQSWDVSLAMHIYADGNAQKFFDFATFLFAHQDNFQNKAFVDLTHTDLRQLVADLAYEFAQFDQNTMLMRLDEGEIYTAGRTPNRYAASRAVWSTPTFLINNADDVSVNHLSTLEDWVSVLKPLL